MKIIKKFFEYAPSVKVPKIAFLIIVPLVLLAGVAVAAVDSQVNACINKQTGSVRVLNFLGGTCSKTEAALSWNIIGPKGDAGTNGTNGINGIDGISGWEKIQSEVIQSSNQAVIATAECPAGKKVLGGGYNVNVDGGTVQALSNEPVSDTSWQVKIIGNVSFSAQAFALCASVQP